MNRIQSISVHVTRAAHWAALLAAALLAASSMHAATAAADTIATNHRVFELKNAYGGNVADLAGANTAEGTRIIQWPSHGGPNQRWRLRGSYHWGPLPNGEYRSVYVIESQHSGLCLEPESVNGAIKVRQATCDIYPNAKQFWYLRRNSYGYYTIQNMHTMTMLHVPNKSAGSELSLTDEFGVTDRMWALNEIKLPYSDTTPGVTVPWGAIGTSETDYCAEGWRVELDAGTWNPRYNPIGDPGVKVTGIIFNGVTTKYSIFDPTTSENNPRKIKLDYYQNSGSDASRNYALTGRVRFYCVPGTTF